MSPRRIRTIVPVAFLAFMGAVTSAVAQPGVSFPLRVSEDRRHLVDSRGVPFFMNGDSPWEISWQLTKEEAEAYLENRRQKGFNAILVDTVPYTEWSEHLTQTNRYGHAPFSSSGDLGKPNEAYFRDLDAVVEAAARKGMLVLLCAADLGSNEMWRPQYISSGPARCGEYARFLGRRFSRFDNILWVLGGDRDPHGVFAHVEEMAKALRETAPKHLITYHAGAKSSGVFFQPVDWFDVNMSYGYRDPHIFVSEDYKRTPVKPAFLGESGYEGENLDGRGGSPHRIRRQAYWSVLSGAFGHLYGSAAWTMKPLWKDWMDSPGAFHMAHLGAFFQSLPWHKLVPDFGRSVIVEGNEEGSTVATTARIPDGSLAVSYLPTPRRVTVDLSRFNGKVEARWFDPTCGKYLPVANSPFENKGSRTFTTPEKNSAGDGDFALVLSVL